MDIQVLKMRQGREDALKNYFEKRISSMRYIANILSSTKSTVYGYITFYLHKKYIHARWIPHSLTEAQKKSRVEGAKEL